MKIIKDKIYFVLKADDRLWNEDKTELNQTRLLDLVENIDEKVIDLLLQEKDLREKFFVKIKDVFVFKTNDFRFFMEENKVDNSYTAYKNRIGLTDGKKFLKDTNDVVLDFPYKDCVLEGGQSTEEGTDTYFEYSEKAEQYEEKQSKRKEIFFNSVLAHDEIDRLFDAKAFTNWKRFTKDGEQEVKEIKRDTDGIIKENLIIKGNNLLALHSLKKQFTGKVKLIYIDPPYNTGNDGFKYNDNFNHSTWLTFMKNRLEVAKELLRDDGVIFVQCDDNEQAYLKVLMDDIEKLNFINCITVKMNESKGLKNAHIEKRLPKSKEYILVYSKNNFLFYPQKIEKDKEELAGYIKYYNKQIINFEKDISLWKIENFSEPIENRISNAEKLIYLVTPDNDIKIDLKENTFGKITNSRGIENYYFNDGKNILKVLFLGQNLHKYIGDLWLDISTININKEGGMQVFSNGQKPEKLLQRILEMATKKDDIVLDYHLGSGTTCAVAHKMGRQYIGIEQMDYVETIAVERLKKVIGEYKQKFIDITENEQLNLKLAEKSKLKYQTLDFDQGGISKSVQWQGGGDFIYFELAKWNETAKEKILAIDENVLGRDIAMQRLYQFFDEMYERYFLNYNLKIKEFRNDIVGNKDFCSLSLDEQKKMFVAMLDNNQMYVNKTEMADKKFGISEEDQKLTEEFYNFKG